MKKIWDYIIEVKEEFLSKKIISVIKRRERKDIYVY